MSRFNETVAKLASHRVKLAIVMQLLQAQQAGKKVKEKLPVSKKEAGVFEHVFGAAGEHPSGHQAIARTIAGGVGTAALTGGGAYLIGKHLDKSHSASETLTSERQQLGKLRGEQHYRENLTKKLAPIHTKVFEAIKKDPVIAKADHALIHSSYETMKRFAPHLAADENATRSFLRENAIYGTGPSYASLKVLADAEQSVGKASGMGS